MSNREAQFLHQRDPNQHNSTEVTTVVDYLRQGGEHIPNDPAAKLEAHLGFLASRDYANDGILTGDQASINRQLEAHTVRAEDVPESYFELQRRILREQGHGDVHITADLKKQMIEAVQADQYASLGKWVEYLGAEAYPDWFKSYTFNAITKLGNYNKEKGEFGKRGPGTTAAYPDLNREALAYVFDALHKSKITREVVDTGQNNEQLQKLLQVANFGKLYIHALKEVSPPPESLKVSINGSWTKFNQTSDPRLARRLSGSLQGHGTGWCTAGESTAAIQLIGGDFYVYYTKDEDGKDTIPRVAIRMQEGEVAEVRGINAAQELEPGLADIASERLAVLPGGEAYIRKAKDMKHLTDIDKRISKDPMTKLTKEEVRFLYEFDGEIEGFGYDRDPRIDAIKAKRGELDYPELKILVAEHLRESFEAAYTGYNTLAEEINSLRSSQQGAKNKRLFGRRHETPSGKLDILAQDQLSALFEAKMKQWEQDGVLDYVAERIITHGELYTPIARPNIVVTATELKQLAHNFAKGQSWSEAYVYDKLYDSFITTEELKQLSGYMETGEPVQFSLLPNTYTDEVNMKHAVDQRQILRQLQVAKPKLGLRVPSVLDGLSLWYMLRANGDTLASGDVWKRTAIRHFDVEPKGSGGLLCVPASGVSVGGRPYLRSSAAEFAVRSRLALG